MCSFPACRNQGTKFLFCAVCGVPVSRRNFRNRHHHERQNAAWNMTNDVKACCLVPDNTTRKENADIGINRVSSPRSNQARAKDSKPEYPSHRAKRGKHKSSPKRASHKTLLHYSRRQSLENVSREDVWLAMLDLRPPEDDRKGSRILAWLETVKVISDKKRPLSEVLSSFLEDQGVDQTFLEWGTSSQHVHCKPTSGQDTTTSTASTSGESSCKSEPPISHIPLGSSSYESSIEASSDGGE